MAVCNCVQVDLNGLDHALDPLAMASENAHVFTKPTLFRQVLGCPSALHALNNHFTLKLDVHFTLKLDVPCDLTDSLYSEALCAGALTCSAA